MINPTIICLVIVGIAITYAIIFALARRETRRRHARTLDMYALNFGVERMQNEKIGYLAVSLGFYKTLFSAPGHSTSSEIPHAERLAMGLSDGMIRLSVGLDDHIERTIERMEICLKAQGLI